MGNCYLCEVEYSLKEERCYYYIQATGGLEAQNKFYKYYDEHLLSAQYGDVLFCNICKISEKEFKEAVDSNIDPIL